MSSSANPLAAASAALAGANKKFPTSMAEAAGAMPMKKTGTSTMMKKSAPVDGGNHEIQDIGTGLLWNKKQTDQVAPVKFHKGGKITKDGVQTVDAEKGETVLPNKNKKKVMELAMKHLDGMKDGMEAGSKKKAAKSGHKVKTSSKAAHKKVHPFKRTEITHHSNGSHTMTHFHDTDAAQDMSGAHEDDSSMMGALQGAMSSPQSLAGASSGSSAPEAAPAAPGMPS